MKKIDSGLTGLGTPSASGVINLINGVAVGTDDTNRIGRVINMANAEIRISYEPNTAGNSQNGDVIRCLLVYDQQTNGTAPTVSQVLQNNNYTEPYNSDFEDRFTILYDEYTNLEANTYTAAVLQNGTPKFHTLTIDMDLDLDTIYKDTGATSTAIATGGLYLLFISAYASWKGTYNSRIWFNDE